MLNNVVLNDIYQKYRENKLAHAYLIETNNIEQATLDLKELIKSLNCPEEYHEKCNNCNLCNLINKGNLPSVVIIEPDGANIKKNQIEELKQNFSSIPLYSRYNTYIIKNAEKLNSSSANAMLKFVEEPTPGILGFFITNNKDVMIDTIKSRCQSYVLNYESKNLLEKLNITEEEYELYKEVLKEYLTKIDSKKFINHKKEILAKLPERFQIINLLKIMLELYYNEFLKRNNATYDEKILEIHKISDNYDKISEKLKIITKILQEMSYNVSIELILDKFVIEMRGNHD